MKIEAGMVLFVSLFLFIYLGIFANFWHPGWVIILLGLLLLVFMNQQCKVSEAETKES